MEAEYTDSSVIVAGVTFTDNTKISTEEDFKERLALSVLNNFDKIEGIGYNFVPDHIETRSLYRDDRPGIEQVILSSIFKKVSNFKSLKFLGKTSNVD